MKKFRDYYGRILLRFFSKKTIRVMKLTLILSILTISQLWATESYSQMTKLTVKLEDVKISDALKEIENQSEFFFLYSPKLIDVERKVNIDAEKESIKDILINIFDEKVKFIVYERQIILTPSEVTSLGEAMQQQKITGTVKDEKGNPLAGVTVLLKGTTLGTLTDMSGKYIITNPPKNATLIFSFVGMTMQEIPSNDKNLIDVVMKEVAIGLDEVVVVGYGTVKKSDLTGSVGSVSSDKLVAFPTTNVLQSLQGKVAGLTITSNNGGPGSSSTIRIRGGSSISTSSDPLWVVDGFPGAPEPQAEDIQSIEVLRDAAACAIYGSRGSNGVIIVTTKKGTAGTLKLDASVATTFMNVSKKIDVLNATDWAKHVNAINKTQHPLSADIFTNTDLGAGTNWQDVIFRTGMLNTYQASVSGGSDKVQVYASAKYSSQSGIIINSSNDVFTGKLNIDAKVTDKTTVGAHVDYGHWTNENVSSQGWYSTLVGAVGTALQFDPNLGIYKADGSTYSTAKYSFGGNKDNPYAIAVAPTNETVGDNFSINMYYDHEIIRGLKFYTSLALSLESDRNGTYSPRSLLNSIGSAGLSTNRNINLNSTTYLTYNKTFADIHKFTLMVGHDYQMSNYEGFSCGSSLVAEDNFLFWNLGSGTKTSTPGSFTSKWIIESFYGRLNYILKDKYLLTVMGREDGSSRLGSNNQHGFFPAASARWNITKEPFMQSISQISQLNVHAGYGSNGNTNLPTYASFATLGSGGAYFQGGVRQGTVIPTSLANLDLTWETSKMTNVGVDLGLFNGKLNFGAEWYNRESTDMLYYVPVPDYTGISNQWQNFGDYRNRGIEFTLGGNLTHGDFNWSSDFNISFNKSTVVRLPSGDVKDGASYATNNPPFILREGETTNTFWGYKYLGANPDDGHAQYAKADGTPTENTDQAQLQILGNANPKFTFGWVNNFTYKGFDLNIQINGSYGNKLINATRAVMESMSDGSNTTPYAWNNSWTTVGQITDVPLAGSENRVTGSSRWIEDASFLRIQNIALGYSLPSSVVNMLKISKCRFYISMQNAFLLTKYKGYDPEAFWNPRQDNPSSNMFRGIDFDSYPHSRDISIGIQATF
jgi:TonB-linked SusC/RagA family outer membrane protein